MAYNALPTVATGDTWAAWQHNLYVGDNFALGVPDIFTAAGQLVYATAANTATVLTLSTRYKMLSISGGVPVWDTQKGVKVTRDSALTISTATLTPIAWVSEDYDTDGYWSGSANTKLIVPAGLSGYYYIHANLIWDDVAAGNRWAYIRQDGSTYLAVGIAKPDAVYDTANSVAVVARLEATEYVELVVYQDSGGDAVLRRYAGNVPLFGMELVR